MEKSLRRAIAEADIETIEVAGKYDAIIVGAGASGGLASALFAEKGLRVLVLDAGWDEGVLARPIAKFIAKSVSMVANPSAMRYLSPRVIWRARRVLRYAGKWRQPIQSQCYAWESAPGQFVDDIDHPYETPDGLPFRWIRCRQLGGRMVVPAHGRQYYRHAREDLSPLDELSPEWPVTFEELTPWYELVERRLGLSGRQENSPWLPDSIITHELKPTAGQAYVADRLVKRWPDIRPWLGRAAPPMPSLAQAAETGRLKIRQGAVVSRLDISDSGALKGVEFLDRQTGSHRRVEAPIVFLCASALESTRLLMLSGKDQNKRVQGLHSPALGRYIMDHVSMKVEGLGPGGHAEPSGPERCLFVPRFDKQTGIAGLATRGYGMRVYQFPGPAGRAHYTAVTDAEILPSPENQVTLSHKRDRWGIPVLRIRCATGDAERPTIDAQRTALREVADALELSLASDRIETPTPGAAIHECGGCRMGNDPRDSVLDPSNQVWGVRGLYVTDGAAFPSIGIHNPTLTIMALTARACDHAVSNC